MNLGLQDRVAIVAGASRGLGRAIAAELCRERARVVLVARTEGPLRDAAEALRRETGGHAHHVAADVSDEADVERIVEETTNRWGKIDITVANAGGPPAGSYETITPEQVRRAVEVNLMSTVFLAKAVTPFMKRQRWGRFIALTSVSVKQPLPSLALSNTARAGVVGFVKSMASDLAPHNVLCNCVAPGYMGTERVDDLLAEQAGREGREPKEVRAELESRIPMGRLGRPEELAALVAFLASERASYITGTTIQTDGGFVQGLL